jgi:putative Mg2+ transporter-C (MgtC) family protein
MIQANILLSIGGKTQESFGVMDLMRMPLGILTGVGFIGAGCILKKGDLITGVTTAATLWIVTIIGLCFGGGQLTLGIITTILCLVVVGILKKLNLLLPHKHYALLSIAVNTETFTPPNLNQLIQPLGYQAHFLQWLCDNKTRRSKLLFAISWKKQKRTLAPYDLLTLLEKDYFIESFKLDASSVDV